MEDRIEMSDEPYSEENAKEEQPIQTDPKPTRTLESATVRFAGDSGDGMQLTGMLFTSSTALRGNDLATLPDYPAEIRAPAGTLPGVSAFQINFASKDIYTPGDKVQTLVALNPAALKVNLPDVERGGTIIVNSDSFNKQSLKLAKYDSNPLEDGTLSSYRVQQIPITQMTHRAVEPAGISSKDADRCKNFLALGIVYWLYDRPVQPTVDWLHGKFKDNPQMGQANELALRAGYNFGLNTEIFQEQYKIEKAHLAPGLYRKIRGNEATALGLIAAARQANKALVYASYPITPASDILHQMSRHKNFGVKTFQAEDEIAAMSAVIGAAYGGALAVTATSGPGMALKTEALGLAVMLELPCVVIDVQRGGPSTGLPTKTEQADLLQAFGGRSGECPVPIIAPQSPSDCFTTCHEAFRIALKYMTPVVVLSEGFLANSSEPWRIPRVEDLPPLEFSHDPPGDPDSFQPYARNEFLARPWVLPGTKGYEHRIGGLEKREGTGNVSYDSENHQRMCEQRATKVAGIVREQKPLQVFGPPEGELLVVSWGGSFGPARAAVERTQRKDAAVSHVHLRFLNPLPQDLGYILKRYKKVLVPELNLGQLLMLIRAKYLVDAVGLNKVQGKPFTITEIEQKIAQLLDLPEESNE